MGYRPFLRRAVLFLFGAHRILTGKRVLGLDRTVISLQDWLLESREAYLKSGIDVDLLKTYEARLRTVKKTRGFILDYHCIDLRANYIEE